MVIWLTPKSKEITKKRKNLRKAGIISHKSDVSLHPTIFTVGVVSINAGAFKYITYLCHQAGQVHKPSPGDETQANLIVE